MLADQSSDSKVTSLYPSLNPLHSSVFEPVQTDADPSSAVATVMQGLPRAGKSPPLMCHTPPPHPIRSLQDSNYSRNPSAVSSPYPLRATMINESDGSAPLGSVTPQSRVSKTNANSQFGKDGAAQRWRDSGLDNTLTGSVRRSILRAPRSPFAHPSNVRRPRPSVSFAKQKEIVTFSLDTERPLLDSNGDTSAGEQLRPVVQRVMLSPVSERNGESSLGSTASPGSREFELREVESSLALNRSSVTGIDGLFLPSSTLYPANPPESCQDSIIRSAADVSSPFGSEVSWSLPSIDDIAKRSAHVPSKIGRPSTLSTAHSPAPIYRFSHRVSITSDAPCSEPPSGHYERLHINERKDGNIGRCEDKTSFLTSASAEATDAQHGVLTSDSPTPLQFSGECLLEGSHRLEEPMRDDQQPVFITAALVDRCSQAFQARASVADDPTEETHLRSVTLAATSPLASPPYGHTDHNQNTCSFIQSLSRPSPVMSSLDQSLSLTESNTTASPQKESSPSLFSTAHIKLQEINTLRNSAEDQIDDLEVYGDKDHELTVSPSHTSDDNNSYHSPLQDASNDEGGRVYNASGLNDFGSHDPVVRVVRPSVSGVSVPRLSLSSIRDAVPDVWDRRPDSSFATNQTKYMATIDRHKSRASVLSPRPYNEADIAIPRSSPLTDRRRREKRASSQPPSSLSSTAPACSSKHNTKRPSMLGPSRSLSYDSIVEKGFSQSRPSDGPVDYSLLSSTDAIISSRKPRTSSVQPVGGTQAFQLQTPRASTTLFTPRTARRTIGPIKVSQGGIWERLENGADRMTPRPREFNPTEIRFSSNVTVPPLNGSSSLETASKFQRTGRSTSEASVPVDRMPPVHEADEETSCASLERPTAPPRPSHFNQCQQTSQPFKHFNSLEPETGEHQSDVSDSETDFLPPITLDRLDTPCRFSDDNRDDDDEDQHLFSDGLPPDASYRKLNSTSPTMHRFSERSDQLLRRSQAARRSVKTPLKMDRRTSTSVHFPCVSDVSSSSVPTISSSVERRPSIPSKTFRQSHGLSIQREKIATTHKETQDSTDVLTNFSSPHFGSAENTRASVLLPSMYATRASEVIDTQNRLKKRSTLSVAHHVMAHRVAEAQEFTAPTNIDACGVMRTTTEAVSDDTKSRNKRKSFQQISHLTRRRTLLSIENGTVATQPTVGTEKNGVLRDPYQGNFYRARVSATSGQELLCKTTQDTTVKGSIRTFDVGQRYGLDSSLPATEAGRTSLSHISRSSSSLAIHRNSEKDIRVSNSSTLLPRRSRTSSTCRKSIGQQVSLGIEVPAPSGIEDGPQRYEPQSYSELCGGSKDRRSRKQNDTSPIYQEVEFPERGVDWNACHAVQRPSLDAQYFNPPHPTVHALSLEATAMVRKEHGRPDTESSSQREEITVQASKHANLGKAVEAAHAKAIDSTEGARNPDAAHKSILSSETDSSTVQREPEGNGVLKNSQNAHTLAQPEDAFTPEHVAILIDWLEARANDNLPSEGNSSDSHGWIDMSPSLESITLLRILDSVRHEPELCVSVIGDGINHLLRLFTSKASMESWEEVLALLDESWRQRFPLVLDQLTTFPTTMLSRYQLWLTQQKGGSYLTTQMYTPFLEHIAERQELTAVLALGQWKLDVSLPAQFGVLERLQATALDLHRAVEQAGRLRDGLHRIQATIPAVEDDSDMREAQQTLRAQLEEALALERKQRDRTVARVQERLMYCERLEATCRQTDRDLIALRQKIKASDEYMRRRQAALRLAVLQGDILEYEQYKAGFRLYEVDLDYTEVEVVPFRYRTEKMQQAWENYISRWVLSGLPNDSVVAANDTSENLFHRWVMDRQKLFEALEDMEIEEDRHYVHQKAHLLLQGLALPPTPKIQIWWRYEDEQHSMNLSSSSSPSTKSTLMEGLRVRIRSGISTDVMEYIPDIFTRMNDEKKLLFNLLPLQRRFLLNTECPSVPLGLGPVLFDWNLRHCLFQYIEERINQRLQKDIQASGLPRPSFIETYLQKASTLEDEHEGLGIPLTAFAPIIGMEKVLASVAVAVIHCDQLEVLMQQHRALYAHYHPTGVSGPETTYVPTGVAISDVRVDSLDVRDFSEQDDSAPTTLPSRSSLVFDEDHVIITVVLRPRSVSLLNNPSPETVTLVLFCSVALSLVFGSFLHGIRRSVSGVFAESTSLATSVLNGWHKRLNQTFTKTLEDLSDVQRKPEMDDLVTLVSTVEKAAGFSSDSVA